MADRLKLAFVISAIDQATKPLQRVGAELQGVSRQASLAGKRLRGAGTTGLTRITLPFTAAAGGALLASGRIEQLQVSFQSLMGGLEPARDMLADVTRFSASTPFQMPDVAGSTQQLLNAGTAVHSVFDELRMLGDIAAGTTNPLVEMTAIYGKAMNRGKIQTEELNQLLERRVAIIPALIDLAKKYGIETDRQRVFDAASKGLITFEHLREAMGLLTAEGGRYHEQMELQSQTLFGRWSTLKDNAFLGMADLGQAIEDAFGVKDRIRALTQAIEDLRAWFAKLREESPGLVKVGLALAGIAAAGPPLLIGLGFLLPVLGKFAGGLGLLLAPLGLLAKGLAIIPALLSPLGLLAGAAAAAGIAAVALGGDWGNLLDRIKTPFPKIWDWLKDAVPGVFAWVGEQWEGAKSGVETAATDIWDWLKNGTPGVFAWVGEQWEGAKSGVETAATDIWDWLKNGTPGVFAWVGEQWEGAKSGVETAATDIWDWLKNGTPGVFAWVGEQWGRAMDGIRAPQPDVWEWLTGGGSGPKKEEPGLLDKVSKWPVVEAFTQFGTVEGAENWATGLLSTMREAVNSDVFADGPEKHGNLLRAAFSRAGLELNEAVAAMAAPGSALETVGEGWAGRAGKALLNVNKEATLLLRDTGLSLGRDLGNFADAFFGRDITGSLAAVGTGGIVSIVSPDTYRGLTAEDLAGAPPRHPHYRSRQPASGVLPGDFLTGSLLDRPVPRTDVGNPPGGRIGVGGEVRVKIEADRGLIPRSTAIRSDNPDVPIVLDTGRLRGSP